MNTQCRDGLFAQFARLTARYSGRPVTFGIAVLTIFAWAVSGPIFGFSDTWQLVINTSTTIVTFLMVFLIQNTQNRDTGALHIKLDEIIRVLKGAHNELIDLEEQSDERLDSIRASYEKLASDARTNLLRGEIDTNTPQVAH